MRQVPETSVIRYDLLAINLTIAVVAVAVLIFYGFITLNAVMALYILTSFTPFDIDFPVSYLNIGPLGIIMAWLCAVSGLFAALFCSLRLRRTSWVLTWVTVGNFILMVATPLLFVAVI